MLSKCANPDCNAKFHYLHEGRVFRVETEHFARGPRPPLLAALLEDGDGARSLPPEVIPPAVPLSSPGLQLLISAQPKQQPAYFWLCAACCELYTLGADSRGVMLLRSPRRTTREAAAS